MAADNDKVVILHSRGSVAQVLKSVVVGPTLSKPYIYWPYSTYLHRYYLSVVARHALN